MGTETSGKTISVDAGGVAMAGCPRPPRSWGQVGWEGPWLLSCVPWREADPASVCSLAPFPWVLCCSPQVATPPWTGPHPCSWRDLRERQVLQAWAEEEDGFLNRGLCCLGECGLG